MNRFVEVGQSMWRMLDETFRHVMRENNAAYQADKAKVWAGFLAAASGGMARDLGKDDAKVVLQGIIGAMEVVTTPETVPAPEASIVEAFARSPRRIPTPTCAVCGEPGCPDHM